MVSVAGGVMLDRVDDKKYRRGLCRYNHIDQADYDPYKYVCKSGISSAAVPCPADCCYNVDFYRSSSAFGFAEQHCASSYPGFYTLRHASSTCQLTDALQLPMYAGQGTVAQQQQQQQSQPQQFPDLYSELQNSSFFYDSETMHRKSDEPSPQYKLKLIMWLALLFVIVGMVVVVLILTISRMQAISSASLYSLRRFEGHFLITEGPLLKFDGRLLQKNTNEFIAHANKIQRQLDLIYKQGGYGLAYVGSEITQFRFVPAVPGLDVTFILKTRSELDINVLDFLSVLRNFVRARGFDGNTIDDKSISLESKRLQ